MASASTDETDRRILRALQADGRISLADLGREVQLPPSTVYRRLSALFAERRARVAVLPLADEASLRLYELRVRCQPGRQREVAHKLTARHDVRWVAVVTGDYDVAAELAVPAGTEVASVLFDDIEKGDDNIVATQTSLVLQTFKGAPPKVGFPCDPELCLSAANACVMLDELDQRVLMLMREDGRRSYASLAAELDVSESTIRRRVNGLIDSGGALPVTIVQPASLGLEQEAIIRLDVLPEHLESVGRELASHEGVHYVAVTFGETALVCEIRMHSPNELYNFLVGTLGRAAGITRMSVEMELMVRKRGFLPTPWTESDAHFDSLTPSTAEPQ